MYIQHALQTDDYYMGNKNLDKFIRAAFHNNRNITRRPGSQYYSSFTRTFVIL